MTPLFFCGFLLIVSSVWDPKMATPPPTVEPVCPDRSCLDSISEFLRINNTAALFFEKISLRLKKRVQTAAKKKEKRNFIVTPMNKLLRSIGGTLTKPSCGGKFNDGDGETGRILHKEMSLCEQNIKDGCSLILSSAENKILDDCNKVTGAFRNGLIDCSSLRKDCSCWKQLATSVDPKEIRNCARKANTIEKEVKVPFSKCLATFSKCKKYEEISAELVFKCKTSMSSLLKTLQSLRVADGLLKRVNTVLSSLRNSRNHAKHSKRQEFRIDQIISTLENFNKTITSNSVYNMGTNTSFKEAASKVIIQTESTDVTIINIQKQKIQDFIDDISSVIQIIGTKISEVTEMIERGGGELPTSSPTSPSPPTSSPESSQTPYQSPSTAFSFATISMMGSMSPTKSSPSPTPTTILQTNILSFGTISFPVTSTISMHEQSATKKSDEKTTSTPFITSTLTPLSTSSTTPFITSSSTPLYTSSSRAMLTSSSTPLLASSSRPLLTSSSMPFLTSSSTPLLTSSSTPLLTYSSSPVLTYSSTTVLTYSSTSFLRSPGPSTEHSILGTRQPPSSSTLFGSLRSSTQNPISSTRWHYTSSTQRSSGKLISPARRLMKISSASRSPRSSTEKSFSPTEGLFKLLKQKQAGKAKTNEI